MLTQVVEGRMTVRRRGSRGGRASLLGEEGLRDFPSDLDHHSGRKDRAIEKKICHTNVLKKIIYIGFILFRHEHNGCKVSLI